MAGIDKTYINGEDYPQYRQWWIDNYEKMNNELGYYIWLYTFSAFYPNEPEIMTPEYLINNELDLREYENETNFTIWNTSIEEDKWLIQNCKIQSYIDRMNIVYSDN